MKALAIEVANASKVLENELPARVTPIRKRNELVATARELERLIARRRKLRRELRAVEQNVRLSKRHLKALLAAEREP